MMVINMSRRTLEALKTVLIAVLLVSAVLLGYSSDVFSGVSGAFTPSQMPSFEHGSTTATPAEAARPTMLVLTNATGGRAVFKYDIDALDLVYERTSGNLGEALVALAFPEECSEDEWRKALQAPGVMFEYPGSIPLELVREWLGSPGEGFGITVRRMCFVFDNNNAALYLDDGEKFYMSQTTALGGELFVAASYESGIKYLFEQENNTTAPYMILHPDNTHATALSYNPLSDSTALADAVSVLGIDLKLTSSYVDTDGTRFYVSNTFDLFISPDGVVNYRRDNAGDAPVGFCESVDIARRVAVSTIGALAGDARVYFTGFYYENNSLTVLFDYFFEGGRVFFPGHSSAAKITVAGGVVTSAELCFRSFSQGESTQLLPERLALTVSGGEFSLGYADSATSAPFWYSHESSQNGGAV